jgi:hypothetical protein
MTPLAILIQFFQIAKNDVRITPIHISVYLAIYQYWLMNDFNNPVQITRKNIMNVAKIKSIVTYHKAITELTKFGYISYIPSYDPRMGSAVYLNIESTSVEN